MAEFRMPSLGADMEAGTMLEWFVKPGDRVQRGDIIAVVDTEKAAIEIEVFESGVIEQLVVQVGETVPVGTVLAMIRTGGPRGAAKAPVDIKPQPVAEPIAKPAPVVPSPSGPHAHAAHITPIAQRLAAELNVDLSTLTGSGIGGAITRADVEQAALDTVAQAPAPPVPHPRVSPAAKKMAGQLGVDLATVRGTGAGGTITKADIEKVEKAKKAQKAALGKKSDIRPTRLRVSPFARRTAAELGVDLHTVHGTGPAGAITKADVEKAATKAVPAPVPVGAPPKAAQPGRAPMTDKHAAMRRAIAAAMSRSKREIPHYYLGTRIDMSKALAWLEAENLQRAVSERLLYSVLLLKAVALAIHDVPEMNGFWTDNVFQPSESIHIGVAISLRQGGLVAPAMHDVDKKTLDELMRDLKDLVKRTRAGVLRSSEISDPTITVTSLGEQGVETVFGVIYPPQVALAGFGKIMQQPWATAGMLGTRAVIHASLAADHRASDGHRGGRFLSAIDRLLQEPEKL